MMEKSTIAPPSRRVWDLAGGILFSRAATEVNSMGRGKSIQLGPKVEWQKVIERARLLFGLTTVKEDIASGLRRLELHRWATESSIGAKALKAGHQLYPWAERNIARMERITVGEALSPEEYRDLTQFLANVSMALSEPRPDSKGIWPPGIK